MVNPFRRRPETMTLAQFTAKGQAHANYGAYLARFGARLSTLNLQALYDRNLRMMDPAGVWNSAQAADYNRVAVANTTLKVNPDDMDTFDMVLGEQLRQDVVKTAGRDVYLQRLRADAVAGRLNARLIQNTLLENTYYIAPPPRPPQPGAPAIPPKPAWAINTNKAIAWAIGNANAGDDVRTNYRRAFLAHSRQGHFPINNMSALNAIWRNLVPGAPIYRSVNIMQPTNYPSSLAGGAIVSNVIRDFANVAQPDQGDDRWYDWALYFYAAIMTSQAFTDGNKRVSRLAYGLVLVHGGVDFRAPNPRLGAELGNM